MLDIATHLPLLTACVARTDGPVLELGCGHYSTPILHSISLADNRMITSVDGNEKWLDTFRDLECSWHKFSYVEDWDKAEVFEKDWDVVLMDHGIARRRGKDTLRLANKAKFIVCHDSHARAYRYKAAFANFRYRYDYDRYSTWTTVVSNYDDLQWLNYK